MQFLAYPLSPPVRRTRNLYVPTFARQPGKAFKRRGDMLRRDMFQHVHRVDPIKDRDPLREIPQVDLIERKALGLHGLRDQVEQGRFEAGIGQFHGLPARAAP